MPHQCTEVFVPDTQGRPLVARRRRSAPLEADPRSPGATSLLGPYCADPKIRLGHAEVATGAPDGARFSDECGRWKDPHGRDAFIACPWRPQRVPATGVGSVPAHKGRIVRQFSTRAELAFSPVAIDYNSSHSG